LKKARVLALADGTRTAAQIAAELGIAPRQPLAHLHVLRKEFGITWKIEDGKLRAVYPKGKGIDDFVGEPEPEPAIDAEPEPAPQPEPDAAGVAVAQAAAVREGRAAGQSLKAIAAGTRLSLNRVRQIVRETEPANGSAKWPAT